MCDLRNPVIRTTVAGRVKKSSPGRLQYLSRRKDDRLSKDQKVKMAATAMRKYLIRWCARQDSNLRPPGSQPAHFP